MFLLLNSVKTLRFSGWMAILEEPTPGKFNPPQTQTGEVKFMTFCEGICAWQLMLLVSTRQTTADQKLWCLWLKVNRRNCESSWWQSGKNRAIWWWRVTSCELANPRDVQDSSDKQMSLFWLVEICWNVLLESTVVSYHTEKVFVCFMVHDSTKS